MSKKPYCLFLLCFFIFTSLYAQTGSMDTVAHFDMKEFPQWGKDLRRGEIIAFGSFPFMYWFATFGYDSFRFATHGGDRRYAPWPLASAGAVEMTQDEKKIVIALAAGGAIVTALVDYGIVRYKRKKQERERMMLAPGTPIIIRSPLYSDDETPLDLDTPETGIP